MAIRTVIWDMGGVFIRTEDPAPRQALAQRLGMERMQLEDLVFDGESGKRAQKGEISFDEHWENLLRILGLPVEARQDFFDQFWGGDYLDRELVDYARQLRKHYKVGLLSNAFGDLRQTVVETWKIADAFDEMIISAEVGMMKPDARIFALAVERLGVAPQEAVFIDDFKHNVKGAQAAGLFAIHFQNSLQVRQDLERILRDGGAA